MGLIKSKPMIQSQLQEKSLDKKKETTQKKL